MWRERVVPISGKRSIPGRRKRSTKVLRKGHAWHIQGTTGTPEELEQRQERGAVGRDRRDHIT